jgi:formamidopyrimidine-DNA glycosylase
VPELPDITVYVEALERRVAGATLTNVRVFGPALLRSVEPPLAAVEGRRALGVRRLGKRVVLALEEEFFLVLHLMIAGRLHWSEPPARAARGRPSARFTFTSGTLTLTEAGTRKRATLHAVRGEAALARHDPGGLDVLAASPPDFAARLVAGNHTLKRALTDPHIFSGIGNAYSDEILHRAKLSPVKLTARLTPEEHARLFRAVQTTLIDWTERLRAEAGQRFPERVTAFREGMAVHGRYREPCPDCGAPVQRIVYAANETNYCAACQTQGRLLADRALSRLLKSDWPRTLEELEERRAGRAESAD